MTAKGRPTRRLSRAWRRRKPDWPKPRRRKDSADRRVTQAVANLTHATDVLKKTTYQAPYAGVITNLPVREGETVVMGIQNAPGSTLMTLADMSIITAEVQVDETDIVNVQLGQPAQVTIDAIPKKSFQSRGDANRRQRHRPFHWRFNFPTNRQQPGSERLQGSGNASGSAGRLAAGAFRDRQDHHGNPNQRADHPYSSPDRCGGGKIWFRKVKKIRSRPPRRRKPVSNERKKRFRAFSCLRNHKAEFVAVESGIAGTTDIEVLKGLKDGDEIITGSYKVLRTLRQGAA